MYVKLMLVALAFAALAIASGCGSDGSGDGSAAPTSDAFGDPAGQPGPDSPTVSINTTEIVVGEQGEAVLAVLNVNSPGLGAWTVDIEYDADVVSIVECESQQGTNVCNDAYTNDTARIVGASAVGLEGDSVIGRLTFQCDAPGESNLDLSVVTLADGTIGDPQLLAPFIEDGAITCTE